MKDEWTCRACQAVNSVVDGECQFCDCDGLECKRDNCSGPDHGQKAIDRILRGGKPKSEG